MRTGQPPQAWSKDAHEIRMQRSPYHEVPKSRPQISSVDSTVIATSVVRHGRAMSFAKRFAQAADFDALVSPRRSVQ